MTIERLKALIVTLKLEGRIYNRVENNRVEMCQYNGDFGKTPHSNIPGGVFQYHVLGEKDCFVVCSNHVERYRSCHWKDQELTD
jgi:hypothetical protein